MATPFRTLFVGTLRQISALSVGGRDTSASVTDAPLCRDGQNRFTLRGQTLIGALVATARRLGDVPEFVSGDISKQQRAASRWLGFASHPKPETRSEIRQHVCINAKTGAAEKTGLFNLEVLPVGTRWPFLLEVDSSGTDGAKAEAIAWQALREWQTGRCYIGREVARGLGWMQLEDLQVVRLDADEPEHIDAWPNARCSDDYPAYVRKLVQRFGNAPFPELAPAISPIQTLEIPFTITVGERSNGYGVDSLSIGGHAESEIMATWQDGHYLAPSCLTAKNCAELFDPDFAMVMTVVDGQRRPFIPGSALRGPLRHALERYYRTTGDWEAQRNNLRRLFGDLERQSRDDEPSLPCYAAALLISDAELCNGNWQAAWFQLHAEDEFTAGTYASSKFDRLALVDAKFTGCWVLETSETDLPCLLSLLEMLKTLAERGDIAIGGGQWRGHGWVNWQFAEPRLIGVNA